MYTQKTTVRCRFSYGVCWKKLLNGIQVRGNFVELCIDAREVEGRFEFGAYAIEIANGTLFIGLNRNVDHGDFISYIRLHSRHIVVRACDNHGNKDKSKANPDSDTAFGATLIFNGCCTHDVFGGIHLSAANGKCCRCLWGSFVCRGSLWGCVFWHIYNDYSLVVVASASTSASTSASASTAGRAPKLRAASLIVAAASLISARIACTSAITAAKSARAVAHASAGVDDDTASSASSGRSTSDTLSVAIRASTAVSAVIVADTSAPFSSNASARVRSNADASVKRVAASSIRCAARRTRSAIRVNISLVIASFFAAIRASISARFSSRAARAASLFSAT